MPRVWPGVWKAVKPGTDIGPSAVSLSSTGTGSGAGMMAATTRIKPLSGWGFVPGDHRCIDHMSHDSSAGPATQLCHVADVVGMPMRQQDGVHLADATLGVLDGALDLVSPSGKPGVDQHHAVVDDDGKSIHISDGDLE